MALLSLIYRTVGAWGAGKGANLTPDEMDANFYAISEAIDALNTSPAQADGIDVITVEGNQMTIQLDSGEELGPYTLPTATLKNRGAWQPDTAYSANDFFTATDPTTLDGYLYFVNRDFTSGATFIPGFGAGVGGADPYATPLVPMPSKVRVAFFFPGKPGVGLPDLGSSETFAPMFSYLTVDSWYVQTTDTASVARLRHAPEFAATYTLYRNNEPIGAVQFLAGATTGTVTIDFDTNFVAGDLLEVSGPTAGIDTLASGLAITIVGTLGALDLGSSS